MLGRAFGGLILTGVPGSRSLHQRRMRRPFPVVPDARLNTPVQSSRPPRILVKSYLALQQLDSQYMQDAPRDLRNFFMTKWKNV
ncbi:uncharacterized protein LOC128256832 [Drosophila gunungcola]|uniref:Uncharacterized protein n=1 Tax=Drosophila gunungcola TaxID=103775 RepID=A0A9P9YEW5_9MUSC|nr:uncharacterized protein LOC128256832 [Drosophila gunungcola]KAI8035696.1 hypothetical protein M5D96_011446 [Drosophila gunungcola]